MFKAITTAFFLTSTVNSEGIGTNTPLKLWSYVESETPLKNRRLENVESKKFIELGVGVSSLKEQINGSQFIEIELPGSETITCNVKSGNPAVGEVLASKFPSLSFFSGSCGELEAGNHQSLQLTFNSEDEDSFSATISSSTRNYYIDSVASGSGKYVIYNTQHARAALVKEGKYLMKDEVRENKAAIKAFQEAAEQSLGKLRGLEEDSEGEFDLATYFDKVASEKRALQDDSHTGWTFKIGFLANQEYSLFHGATRESVFSAIVTMITRINGIFTREFASFFELIENQDLLICLPGRQEPAARRRFCRRLPNDSSVLDTAAQMMQTLGVEPEEYDIGHVITTGFGGLAAYPSMCTSVKAQGTTGLPEPEGDAFAVDFVAHEIGHQLFGAHIFRDCDGPEGNFNPDGAAEPGGGTSIMGYAGLCGENDIQDESDPYFNSVNLVPMYNFILSVAEDGVCGTSFPVSPIINRLSTNLVTPDRCTVPLGSSFQLNASGITSDGFFSWERSDQGYEDLDETELGRFRSWKPTKIVSRFFPNLYFQTFGESLREEALPEIPRSMSFRFVERTLYDTFAAESNISAGVLGEFQTIDTRVQFDDDLSPLVIDAASVGASVTAGETFSVSYSAEPGVVVEFFAAVNTLEEVEEFDYEDNMVELDWVAAGTGSEGTGTVNIPSSVTGTVALMARVGDSGCFYFDLIPRLVVV